MIFSSPLFFWALGLLAIPIIIHLYNFRRYKTLYFSDVSLLKEIQTKTQTKNKLQHQLVLLARLLFLAALVIAFTEPRLAGNLGKTDKQLAVSIYLDNSLSMQAEDENGSLMQSAIQKAYQIAESYPRGTQFQLITNDLSAEQRHFADAQGFTESLDKVETSVLFQPLSRIFSYQHTSAEEAELSNTILYLLSDFQNIIDSNASWADSSIELRIIPFSTTNYANISIDSLWIDAPSVSIGQAVDVHFRIHNRGLESRMDEIVSLMGGKEVLNTLTISLDAMTYADTTISLLLSEENGTTFSIQVDDIPVEFDNRLYFTLSPRVAFDVREISPVGGNESSFSRLFNSEIFEYGEMGSTALVEDSLRNTDLLILNQVENWNSGLFALVNEHLKSGKNALIVLPEVLNQKAIGDFSSEFGISVQTWDTSNVDVNFIQTKDPLFGDVFESQTANLNYPKSKGRWKLESNAKSQSIMRFYDGSDLLCAVEDEGRLFVITSPLKAEFTNFQQHALFVPAVLNMALQSGGSAELYYTIGINKIRSFKNVAEGTRIASVSDSFSFMPASSYDGLNLNYEIRNDGHYQLLEPEEPPISLSFNHDRIESVRLQPEEINQLISATFPSVKLIELDNENTAYSISEADLGTSLWQWFVLAALLFFLAETILLKLFSK